MNCCGAFCILLAGFGIYCLYFPFGGKRHCKTIPLTDHIYPMTKQFSPGGSGVFQDDTNPNPQESLNGLMIIKTIQIISYGLLRTASHSINMTGDLSSSMKAGDFGDTRHRDCW